MKKNPENKVPVITSKDIVTGNTVPEKEIRAKLITKGPQALTNSELLSIIIQEGNSSCSSFELAERVLEKVNNDLGGLALADLKSLRIAEGLGIKKAAIIIAARELGKRIITDEANNRKFISGSNDVIDIFKPKLGNLPYEEFWVIYLSNANTILEKTKVSQGGAATTTVEPRIIIKRAIELLASGIILVHNHPSGIAEPSQDDITLTNKISEGAALFGISILDHIIITSGEFLSFRKENLLN